MIRPLIYQRLMYLCAGTSLWVILAALIGMSAGSKDAATTRPDTEAIQGTWKWVSVEDQGKVMPWPDGSRLVITPDLLKIVYPKDTSMGWKYTLDPSKDPKEMDWFVEEDPGHPIHQMAIYALDGDSLKICFVAAGNPRPADFVSRKGDFGGLWILKRVTPASTQPGVH